MDFSINRLLPAHFRAMRFIWARPGIWQARAHLPNSLTPEQAWNGWMEQSILMELWQALTCMESLTRTSGGMNSLAPCAVPLVFHPHRKRALPQKSVTRG